MRIFRPLILMATAALARVRPRAHSDRGRPAELCEHPRRRSRCDPRLRPGRLFRRGRPAQRPPELAVERNGARWLFSTPPTRPDSRPIRSAIRRPMAATAPTASRRATSSRSTPRPGRSSMAGSTSTTTARSARPGARTCRATCTRPTGTGRGSSANRRATPPLSAFRAAAPPSRALRPAPVQPLERVSPPVVPHHVCRALSEAGIETPFRIDPDGHNWELWPSELGPALEWLDRHLSTFTSC